MEINKLSVKGSPHIGIYIFANDEIALVPPGLGKSEIEVLMDTLKVEVMETKIADTELIGVMIVGNNKGLILPRNVLDEEVERLKPFLTQHDINLYISRSKHTALGNIVLTNNRAAIIGTILEKQEVNKIAETLDVEVEVRDIMYLNIPGSLAVVTDKGGAIHPDVTDEEIMHIEEILGVGIERATVNAGIPFIKSGLIANTHGILVGEKTTGPEILRIRRGLGGG